MLGDRAVPPDTTRPHVRRDPRLHLSGMGEVAQLYTQWTSWNQVGSQLCKEAGNMLETNCLNFSLELQHIKKKTLLRDKYLAWIDKLQYKVFDMVAPPQPNCLQLFKQKNRAFYTTGPWSTLRSMEHKVKFKAIEQPDMFQITCRLIPGRWQTNSQTKNLCFFFRRGYVQVPPALHVW